MKKMKSKERPIVSNLIICVVISLVVGIIMTAILTYITLNNRLSYDAAGKAMCIIHFVGVLCGCISAMSGSVKKGILLPLAVCLAYIFILLGTNVLCFDSSIKIGIADIAACILPALISVLILNGRAGKGRTVKHRR